MAEKTTIKAPATAHHSRNNEAAASTFFEPEAEVVVQRQEVETPTQAAPPPVDQPPPPMPPDDPGAGAPAAPPAPPPAAPPAGPPSAPPAAPPGSPAGTGNPSGAPSMDWFSLSRPFFNRGVPWLRMDANSGVEAYWNYNYQFFTGLGLPGSTASWLSNQTTPMAIDNQLAPQFPTRWEQMDREMNTSSLVFAPTVWQFKTLAVNEPGDAAEQQAEAVADRISAGKSAAADPTKPFAPATATVQRKENNPAQGNTAKAASVLQQPGQPLPTALRKTMEERFGSDFSQVQIHANSTSAQAAADLQARAFTAGEHIVFGQGQYDPDTASGKKLLAHELTHVVQQREGNLSIQRAIINGPAQADGFAPLASDATSTGGLYQDLMSRLTPGTGENYAFVLSQFGLTVYNLGTGRVANRYPPRTTEGSLPSGIYLFGRGGSFDVYGTLNNQIIHRGLAFDPRQGFSADRLAIIHQRRGMVIIEDFIDVTVADLLANGYLPAHAIAGTVAETASGGEATGRSATWATGQLRQVRERLQSSPPAASEDSADGESDQAQTPPAPKPDRLVGWVREDGREFVNVWVNGAVQTLELTQNQSVEVLESRILEASENLYNTRDPNQSTNIAEGATETGFTTPPAGSRPQRELPGSGVPSDQIDPEQRRQMIDNGDRGANLPPYPARINNYGTSISVSGGNNRMAMEIDYAIAGSDNLSQVAARLQHISYYWEIFDVTNVEIPTPEAGQTPDLSAYKPGQNSEYIGAGSGAGNELSRDFSNIWEDQRADLLEMADAGLLNIPLWQLRASQLSLMALSSTMRSIGSLISSYVSVVTTPLNERNIGWDHEGEFLVRCVATPSSSPEDPYRRASSIAVVPIKVMNINTRATTELGRPDSDLQRLRDQLQRTPDGPNRDELAAQIAAMERARDQTTMQNVDEQVANTRTQLAAIDEIIAARASGAAPTTMSIAARLLRVQLELSGADPNRLKERLQQQLEQLTNMQRFGNTQAAALKSPIYKPRVVLASEENGTVFQMVMMLGELTTSTERRRRYRLVDLSSPSTQDYYDGDSTQAGDAGISEAIKNAFIRFRENNGYGRGTIAVRLPPGLDRAGTVPTTMRSAPGSRERWMQRLRDLATAAEIAGLILTGPAGMAVGLIGGAAGAITAVDNMMRRSHGDRLTLDFQTFMDITAIVGGAVPFAGLSRRYERAVYYFGVAQLGQSALVIPIELIHQLEAINDDPSLAPGERRARQAEAFLTAVKSGVVTVISARQMMEHGPPAAYVENAPVPAVDPASPRTPQDAPQIVDVEDGPNTPRSSRPPESLPPAPDGETPRPQDAEEQAPRDGEQQPHPMPQQQSQGPRPPAKNLLKIRVMELVNGIRLSEHPNSETRATQRQQQLNTLLSQHPDLVQLGEQAILESRGFGDMRQLVRDGFFGDQPEHNSLAREAIQLARMQLGNRAMAEAVVRMNDLYPNLQSNLLDMGTPGFGSDRDVTMQFSGPEGSIRQQIDASLQAVRLAYDFLRRAGIEPDLMLDTNFYTELHEHAIQPANAAENARIVFDQSVTSLAEMRMHMSNAEWSAYKRQQMERLRSPNTEAESMQGRMEADARTRLEAEFAAAEALAQNLRPDGQTAAQRDALLATRRQELSDALRRNAPAEVLRRLMAEIKLLEPEAYGTRAAVESVVGRQQTWARGDANTYITEGRSLPTNRSERLAFLTQDASANTALLYGHTQVTGNTMSKARAAAKYLQRVVHAVMVDGRIAGARHDAIRQTLLEILATKSVQPAAEGEARAEALMRRSLRPLDGYGERVNTMTPQEVMDAYVQEARVAASDLLGTIRAAEQMSHAMDETGVPRSGTDTPPTTPRPPEDPSGAAPESAPPSTPEAGSITETGSERPTTPPPSRTPSTEATPPAQRVVRTSGDIFWVTDSSHPRFSVRAELENGTLTITMRTVLEDGTRSSVLRGAVEYANIMAYFGGQIQAIKGSWQYGDNLATINRHTGEGMPLEQAIRLTWSAQQAARFGFTEIVVTEPTSGTRPEGGYQSVKAIFRKPAPSEPTGTTTPGETTTPIANTGEDHDRR